MSLSTNRACFITVLSLGTGCSWPDTAPWEHRFGEEPKLWL